jgi:hypothetical protein
MFSCIGIGISENAWGRSQCFTWLAVNCVNVNESYSSAVSCIACNVFIIMKVHLRKCLGQEPLLYLPWPLV